MYKEALCFKQVVADAQASAFSLLLVDTVEKLTTLYFKSIAQTVIQLCGDDQEEHSEEDVMIKTVLAFPGTANPFEKRRFLPTAWARYLQGLGYKVFSLHFIIECTRISVLKPLLISAGDKKQRSRCVKEGQRIRK